MEVIDMGTEMIKKHFIFTEEEINTSDMTYENGVIYCHNKKLRWYITKNSDYATLKKKFVLMRYSNDDQIAIILNKEDSDEDALLYERMQEWRIWSANISKQILELINNSNQ